MSFGIVNIRMKDGHPRRQTRRVDSSVPAGPQISLTYPDVNATWTIKPSILAMRKKERKKEKERKNTANVNRAGNCLSLTRNSTSSNDSLKGVTRHGCPGKGQASRLVWDITHLTNFPFCLYYPWMGR